VQAARCLRGSRKHSPLPRKVKLSHITGCNLQTRNAVALVPITDVQYKNKRQTLARLQMSSKLSNIHAMCTCSDEQPLSPQNLLAAHRTARQAAAASAAHASMAAGDQGNLHCSHHAHIAVSAWHPWRALSLRIPSLAGSLILLLRNVQHCLCWLICKTQKCSGLCFKDKSLAQRLTRCQAKFKIECIWPTRCPYAKPA